MLRIKDGYIIKIVAGENIVVAVGAESERFNGMLNLTETGALLWQKLCNGATIDSLTKALTDEYEVEQAQAEADARAFVQKLAESGFLDEES
jgi:hypothetical protein